LQPPVAKTAQTVLHPRHQTLRPLSCGQRIEPLHTPQLRCV